MKRREEKWRENFQKKINDGKTQKNKMVGKKPKVENAGKIQKICNGRKKILKENEKINNKVLEKISKNTKLPKKIQKVTRKN